jgi:hypothetical protein
VFRLHSSIRGVRASGRTSTRTTISPPLTCRPGTSDRRFPIFLVTINGVASPTPQVHSDRARHSRDRRKSPILYMAGFPICRNAGPCCKSTLAGRASGHYWG